MRYLADGWPPGNKNFPLTGFRPKAQEPAFRFELRESERENTD